MTLTYDAAQTARLLPYAPLAEEIAATLALKARGGVIAPRRLTLPLPDGGALLVMPATDGVLAVTKLITVTPANAGRNLPLIRGEVSVVRASDGERLGVLDGPEVTARRTAAASLLAARLLAPRPEGPLLVVGTGVQALSHAMAFAEGLGVGEVFIHGRDRSKAGALAGRLGEAGVDALAVERPEVAMERASLIVTATNSPVPVIPGNARDDAFIAAVGSFHPDRVEIPASLVRRCRVFTDDLDAARSEAGDIIQAGAGWDGVTPLEQIASRLEVSGPVLYKAVGCAVLDLAAARLAFSERS